VRGGSHRGHPRGSLLRGGRHPVRTDARPVRAGRRESAGRVEQLRRRRDRPGHTAGRGTDRTSHRLLRRRERRAGPPVSERGTGTRPAGHTGRTAAGGRLRYHRLLHPGRRRHAGRRRWSAVALRSRRRRGDGRTGEGDPVVRRHRLRAGVRGHHRLRPGRGRPRRPSRQPRLRPFRAELQPFGSHARRITIAEVEELVEPGALDPDEVHLPGVFVQRVLTPTPAHAADKHIEKRSVRRP
jgi:Coenzyme A transferase